MKQSESRRRAAYAVLAWSKRVFPEKPLWQCTFDESVSHKLRVMLEASLKREEMLERKFTTKPKLRPCAKCIKRRKLNLVRKIRESKERLPSIDIKKIITGIVECWPDFKKVPELQWNLYMDNTGTCRCGRKISPIRIMMGPGARTCSYECQELKKKSKKMRRLILKSQERRMIVEQAQGEEYE